MEDTTEFVGKTLEVRVITVDSDRQKLVLSAKDVLKEKEVERLNHKIFHDRAGYSCRGARGKPDAIRCICGSWRWIKRFGTHFPDQQKRLKKPSEVLTVGDTVRAVVLNTKDNRISLSIKQRPRTQSRTSWKKNRRKIQLEGGGRHLAGRSAEGVKAVSRPLTGQTFCATVSI